MSMALNDLEQFQMMNGKPLNPAKALNWQVLVSSFTDVQRLIHLAMRLTDDDETRIKGELLRVRRRAYEDELTIQARRSGCDSRRGRLGNNDSLTALSEMSQRDAASIVNTYNYDLGIAIQHVASETPNANRNTYAKRLSEWDTKRNQWKAAQIAEYTEGSARSQAQADFYAFNNIEGVAILQPGTAAEPICQGWINRGEVPLRVALNNPPPYHVNCPHLWETRPNKMDSEGCDDLWMGQ